MPIQVANESESIEAQIDSLESSIESLLNLCNKLSNENKSFKETNTRLLHERSELQLKNNKARTQVEAIVERLKTLENAS